MPAVASVPALDAMETDSTSWFVLMLLAGIAVGVAIAIARTVFQNDDE